MITINLMFVLKIISLCLLGLMIFGYMIFTFKEKENFSFISIFLVVLIFAIPFIYILLN